MTDIAESAVPEGWYPNPTGGTELRWWDGTTWTAHTLAEAPAAAIQQATPASERVAAPVTVTSATFSEPDATPNPGRHSSQGLPDTDTYVGTHTGSIELPSRRELRAKRIAEEAEAAAQSPSALETPAESTLLDALEQSFEPTPVVAAPVSYFTPAASVPSTSEPVAGPQSMTLGTTATAPAESPTGVTLAALTPAALEAFMAKAEAELDFANVMNGQPEPPVSPKPKVRFDWKLPTAPHKVSEPAEIEFAATDTPISSSEPLDPVAIITPALTNVPSQPATATRTTEPRSASILRADPARATAAAPRLVPPIFTPQPLGAQLEHSSDPASYGVTATSTSTGTATATLIAPAPAAQTGGPQNAFSRITSVPERGTFVPFATQTPWRPAETERPDVINTLSAWVLALIPLLYPVVLITVIFALDIYIPAVKYGIAAIFVLWMLLLVVRDSRELKLAGHKKVASPAWILLTPLAYLIARGVNVRRQTDRGFGPLVLWLVLSAIQVGMVVAVPVLQQLWR